MAMELPPFGVDEDPANDEARVPPHDHAAEAAVLSAIIYSPGALAKVSPLLLPEHFFSEKHRRIYEAIVSLAVEGHPIDPVLVGTRLRETGRLAQVGGAAGLIEILNAAPVAGNAAAYAATVAKNYQARQAILTAQRIQAMAYAGSDPAALLASAVEDLEKLRGSPAAEPGILFGADLTSPLEPIEYVCSALKLAPGAPTLAAGNAFSGKSLAWADVVMAVATGTSAWGAWSCGLGRGLMLDYDGQGERISKERFQRLARARGIDLGALGNRLGYLRRPGFYLDDSDGFDRLLRLLDGFSLCVIDSWRGATPATDEWRRGPVQIVGDRLERVSTKIGCTIVVIDHNVKPPREGTSERSAMHDVHGTTAKTEMAQSHFAFSGRKGEQTTRVEHVKERITGLEVVPFALRFEDVPVGADPRGGLRVVHLDREQMRPGNLKPAGAAKFEALKGAILETVRQQPTLTSCNQICARITGGGKDVKLEAIRELEKEGRLVQPEGEGAAYRVCE